METNSTEKAPLYHTIIFFRMRYGVEIRYATTPYSRSVRPSEEAGRRLIRELLRDLGLDPDQCLDSVKVDFGPTEADRERCLAVYGGIRRRFPEHAPLEMWGRLTRGRGTN